MNPSGSPSEQTAYVSGTRAHKVTPQRRIVGTAPCTDIWERRYSSMYSNLWIGWRRVGSFMPRPHYPGGRAPVPFGEEVV
jgi:hypothetical protein